VFDNGSNDLVLGAFGAQNVTVEDAGAVTTNAANLTLTALSVTGASIALSNDYTVAGATTLHATGANGPVNISAVLTGNGATTAVTSDTGNVNVLNNGTVTAANALTMEATTGKISLVGPISGTTVGLTSGSNAADAMSQATGANTSGTIGGGALTINLTNGGTAALGTLANNVDSLAGTGNGTIVFDNGSNDLVLGAFGAQNVTVEDAGAVTTNAANLTLTALSVTGASIALSNDYTVAGATTLHATGANGPVNISAVLTGNGATTAVTSYTGNVNVLNNGTVTAANALTMEATTGKISLVGPISGTTVGLTSGSNAADAMSQATGANTSGTIGGGALTINLTNGGTAALGTLANNVDSLAGTGNGTIVFDNGSNDLVL